MWPSPSTRIPLNQRPPCGAKSTLTTNPTPAPHLSPATPPRTINPLLPSEPQQNAKAALFHLPSFGGQQIIHSMPTILTASDKERTTLPYALAPTPPIPNSTPWSPTGPTNIPRNTSYSIALSTPVPKPHTFAVSHFSRSSST